jgi:hypothetical protein
MLRPHAKIWKEGRRCSAHRNKVFLSASVPCDEHSRKSWPNRNTRGLCRPRRTTRPSRAERKLSSRRCWQKNTTPAHNLQRRHWPPDLPNLRALGLRYAGAGSVRHREQPVTTGQVGQLIALIVGVRRGAYGRPARPMCYSRSPGQGCASRPRRSSGAWIMASTRPSHTPSSSRACRRSRRRCLPQASAAHL